MIYTPSSVEYTPPVCEIQLIDADRCNHETLEKDDFASLIWCALCGLELSSYALWQQERSARIAIEKTLAHRCAMCESPSGRPMLGLDLA